MSHNDDSTTGKHHPDSRHNMSSPTITAPSSGHSELHEQDPEKLGQEALQEDRAASSNRTSSLTIPESPIKASELHEEDPEKLGQEAWDEDHHVRPTSTEVIADKLHRIRINNQPSSADKPASTSYDQTVNEYDTDDYEDYPSVKPSTKQPRAEDLPTPIPDPDALPTYSESMSRSQASEELAVSPYAAEHDVLAVEQQCSASAAAANDREEKKWMAGVAVHSGGFASLPVEHRGLSDDHADGPRASAASHSVDGEAEGHK